MEEEEEDWEQQVRNLYFKFAEKAYQELTTFIVETMSPEDQAIFNSLFGSKNSSEDT